MPTLDLSKDIQFAHHLADLARDVIHPYFRGDFSLAQKLDLSPVTQADQETEKKLRALIEQRFPDDGIRGEEFGLKPSRNGRTWVLDPIDGTKSFVVGRPTFGTLIALCHDSRPVLGIIDQPILKERWVGAHGTPTLFQGQPVKTTACLNIASARCSSTSPLQIPHLWEKLYKKTRMMVWGGDCYSYGLMANGGIDIVIESGMKPYDFCALIPIIQGAGGVMCDWHGQDLTLESEGECLAVSDKALIPEILDFLKS
jgi:histidinol phosphatase-like enzyme (inositol monophosphatase family)